MDLIVCGVEVGAAFGSAASISDCDFAAYLVTFHMLQYVIIVELRTPAMP